MGVLQGGLCVRNVASVDLHEAAPVLNAETWRIVPKGDPGVASLLRFYWESELADTHDLWVYSDDDVSWVFVEENDDYKRATGGIVQMYPSGDGSNWEYIFNDFADVLIIILPPGIGVAETSPPAQATVKHDRLVLYFMFPEIYDYRQGNWTATVKLCKVRDTATLTRIVGDLNHQARTAAPISQVQKRDQVSRSRPDSTLQAMMESTPAASGRIFISYRRQDASAIAGRLYDRLVRRFGADRIFIDVDTSTPGADFGQAIASTVAACKVLLAVIGPDWLTAAAGRSHRRLDDPDDSVRREIETALARGVRVVPILAEGAVMPWRKDLPESLAGLARRNAYLIRNESFHYDAERLVVLLERVLEAPGTVAVPIAPDAHEQETRPGEDANEQIKEVYSAAMSPAIARAKQETQLQPPKHRQPKIFLCYRRDDAQGFARGIYESLASKYGREHVFRDIDSTPAGVRFPTWIESMVGQCSVMIVLMGAAWPSVKDRTGQRRLDLPKDWVRQEIEVALRREIPIIPVRIQGAPMPPEDELPPSIAELTNFQSAEVTDSRWDFDMGVLIHDIDSLIASD